MKRRILALVLALGLLALPAAPLAAASGVDTASSLDAIVVVSEDDLPALLASGLLGEYSLVSAPEVGLDEAALAGVGLLSDDAVLTPSALGLDTPEQNVFAGLGLFPFFSGFTSVNVRVSVPVLAFRPITVRTVHVPPVPLFRNVNVVVLRPPPPPVVLAPLPPPPVVLPGPPLPRVAPGAACCPPTHAAVPFREVPIIPEADSLVLVAGGLVVLGALAGLRALRRRAS